MGGIVQGDEGPIGVVAQVIGYHGVTVVVGPQEQGQEEEVEKQGEVEGEGEKLKDHYTWMECGWNDKTSASGLSHVECDEWSNEDTKDSVHVCPILHVAHVVVRRVTLVIVHNGLNDVEGVLVVFHTFT